MSTLKILVGLSGAGKSTIAKQLLVNENTTLMSSDDIRAELWGDAADQQSPDKVFQVMQKRTIDALLNGNDVVYDATNVNARRRVGFIKQLQYKVPNLDVECHIVVAPIDKCIEHQQLRDRVVPTYAIRRQAAGFQVPGYDEPYNKIYVYNNYYNPTYLSTIQAANVNVPQLSKWHQETVDKHTAMVEQYAREHGFSEKLQKLATLHDIGKHLTVAVDKEGEHHFYGHEGVGAYLYLCAEAPTGELDEATHEMALMIQYHSLAYSENSKETMMARLGAEMYQDLMQFSEADTNGAVRRDEMDTMSVLKWMNAFEDWEERLAQPPYCITAKHDGDYVLLKYQQLNSDFSTRCVHEARGSIFKKDENGLWQYVCRPFDKFFNYGQAEADEIDWSTARVLEKVDGSLMKCFYDNGEWHLATNGLPDAFKAQVSDMGYSYGDIFNRALGYDFRDMCKGLDPEYTYMFELTGPDIQLVVPYDDGVWYLSRRHNETGVEDFERPFIPGVKYPREYFINNLDDVLAVVSKMGKDEEGFVVNDAQSHRIKVKSPEYLMAHHLLNNKMVSNRNLVMYIQSDTLDDFLAYCPQFTGRAMEIIDKFQAVCQEMDAAWDAFKGYADLPRKEFASMVRGQREMGYLFRKYDNPDITAESHLKEQLTPALMRRLGLKNDEPVQIQDAIEVEEDER